MALLRIIILLLALQAPSFADEVPVLLMLKRAEQADTTGCNFVEQVTAIVYKEIVENRVKLWDSPQKEIQIAGSTLQEIEKNSGVSFLSQEMIFMYETWNAGKKEVLTKTLGFSFFNKSENDEVSFGYVDYKDLNELFQKTKINTNSNGNYSSTFTTYVLNKNFIYNIVQFGGKKVASIADSDEIKRNYTRGLPFNQTLLGYYPPDKYVSYLIDVFSEDTDTKSVNSKKITREIEEYLLKNQEVFFNMGGDRITSHIQKNKIKVTKVEVNEIWRKMNGEIVYEPKSMIIYVNDSALNEMSPRAIGDMTVEIDEKNMPQLLKEKNFNFIITRINSQIIKRKDSYLYFKGLTSSEWNRVIDYVVNY